MVILSPLYVYVSCRKKFILNLNNYRNAHYQIPNKAKMAYNTAIAEQAVKLNKAEKVSIHYTLYPKTKRLTDIGNVVSIHKKFFEDAIVELGIIPDDNYKHVVFSSESFGDVDRINPRVEIRISYDI